MSAPEPTSPPPQNIHLQSHLIRKGRDRIREKDGPRGGEEGGKKSNSVGHVGGRARVLVRPARRYCRARESVTGIQEEEEKKRGGYRGRRQFIFLPPPPRPRPRPRPRPPQRFVETDMLPPHTHRDILARSPDNKYRPLAPPLHRGGY